MYIEDGASLTRFTGLQLETSPGRVMTPRPASAELVRRAVDHLGPGGLAADVGTGSGAIALATAARSPRSTVYATDTSQAAVALAERNAARLGLAGRVRVLLGDLLAPVPSELDVVVANLPYLPWTEVDAHPDLADEPPAALFFGTDGLEPSRRLVRQAAAHLRPNGLLVLQIRGRVVAAERPALPALAAWLSPGSGLEEASLPSKPNRRGDPQCSVNCSEEHRGIRLTHR